MRGWVPLYVYLSGMVSVLLSIIVIVHILGGYLPTQIAHNLCTYYRLRISMFGFLSLFCHFWNRMKPKPVINSLDENILLSWKNMK